MELDRALERRSLAHRQADEILVSLPGMGTLLGAEFLVAVGDPRDTSLPTRVSSQLHRVR